MSTSLQLRPVGSMNLNELQTLGQVFTKSGFFADTRDAAQAVVKVMAGAELGFPPIASMTGVYIVKGKVSLSANLMAAAIKRSGKYTYRVRQLDEGGCKLEFFEGGESLGVSSFTKKDAQEAGLGGDTWKKFFRNMAFARAMSNGARWYTPDIFGGPIYTPEELGADVDGETGEVIEVEPEPMRMVSPQPSEAAEDLEAHIHDEPREAEPEPVRPVKLEGAQSKAEPKPVIGPKTKQIRGWMDAMGWEATDLANYIYENFGGLAVDDADAVVAVNALSNGQKKTLHQMIQGEFEKGAK